VLNGSRAALPSARAKNRSSARTRSPLLLVVDQRSSNPFDDDRARRIVLEDLGKRGGVPAVLQEVHEQQELEIVRPL
jgi:hypothetical protein